MAHQKIQNENVGLRNNFNDVVSRANGEYIFLLGDEDILIPDFIKIILPILRARKYSIVHFNRLSGDERCSNHHIHDIQFIKTAEELSFNDFVKRVMSSPNFISSIILVLIYNLAETI